MLTQEEYFKYYEKTGKTIDQMSKSKNKLNSRQLETKYKKYCSKEEIKNNKTFKKDEKWEETKKEVFQRDQGLCQLKSKLSSMERIELIKNSSGLHNIVDPAHYKGRGAYPHLKYEVSNVWTLNRYSHSMLDQRKSPVNGKPITTEEHTAWWKIIRSKNGKKEFS